MSVPRSWAEEAGLTDRKRLQKTEPKNRSGLVIFVFFFVFFSLTQRLFLRLGLFPTAMGSWIGHFQTTVLGLGSQVTFCVRIKSVNMSLTLATLGHWAVRSPTLAQKVR